MKLACRRASGNPAWPPYIVNPTRGINLGQHGMRASTACSCHSLWKRDAQRIYTSDHDGRIDALYQDHNNRIAAARLLDRNATYRRQPTLRHAGDKVHVPTIEEG